MLQPSSRLGYYVISLGIALQVLGLAGDSWTRDPNATNEAFLAMSNPSHVLLMLGLVTIIFGTVLGFLGLSQELASAPAREARLLPALPLVLLVGISLGSATFAYQTGNASTNAVQAPSPRVSVSEQPGPSDCPEGTFWHPDMGHCMIPATPGDGAAAVPICPTDYAWSASDARCVAVSVSSGPSVTESEQNGPSTTTPACPSGTVWHEAMGQCMSTVCPAGYQWDASNFTCRQVLAPNETPAPNATPACPSGTFWHPTMDHCMPTSCPTGYQWDWTYLTCLQVAGPPPATSTPAPVPSQTPQPTPTPIGPTPTPAGPTPTPLPSCPDGYFWHPSMGHCMPTTCPPGLVLNWDTGYCDLPENVTQTPPATATEPPAASTTPTPTPRPSCPDGYFWHPAMGHCMSTTCPPGLVLNAELYCDLPPTPTLTSPG